MGKVCLALLVLLLLLTAFNGLVEGISATHYADTRGMRLATATQLLYGGLALAALGALAFRRRWVFGLLVAWGISVTVTATLAPVVYGGTPVRDGVLAGSITGAVVALILWCWRRLARNQESGVRSQD